MIDGIETIRSFNRSVGRRLGAMDERFLGRARPMGEARVLWEIGPEGAEVRALRARLGLDSGYLSRLLRSLEQDGMVTTAPNPEDRRIRRAELTASGLAERAVLDERSDLLAGDVLRPLTDTQRDRLLEAMETVEKLLTAGAVELRDVHPSHPDSERCLTAYRDELARRTGRDPAASLPVPEEAVQPPLGRTLVAYRGDTAIGCGALKGGKVPEVKRLWVSAEARGVGLGWRLMEALHAEAVDRGATRVRLDTNTALTEAVTLYRRLGYEEVAPYNDEPMSDCWMEKKL
ncbi:MAG TPA: helix-turn-helix domain-containing GNAT family N-acetyltransferase [Thermoleophilaceae bacterium]|nr:helix-turn-helix domain-containing GNAT family N-acetyltransferase [Thermoleophilaceae bacterium]